MTYLYRSAVVAAMVATAACAPPGSNMGSGSNIGSMSPQHATAPGADAQSAHAAHGPAAGAHGQQHHPDAEAMPVASGADRPQHAGNVTMAARLAQMIIDLPADGRGYESIKILEALLAAGPPADPQQHLKYGYDVAVAQMNSGNLEDAIKGFTELQNGLRGRASLTDSKDLRQITSFLAITWMRLGETQNCALNHNVDSCFLPIKGGGVHKDTSAVERAIPELELLVRSDPNDLTSRWLLNIANMARGTYPDGVDPRYRIDPHVFDSQDDIGRFMDVAPSVGFGVAGRAGGVIVDDFTNDGNLDVIASGWAPDEGLHVFISKGDGTFEDHTEAAGLGGMMGGLNMLQADYDGDGWLDILVLRGAWRQGKNIFPNSLLRNRGDGTFEDVTESAGLLSYHPTQNAGWADYDADGDLDLFIGNETGSDGFEHPNELYRNEGDGTFVDVAHALGLDVGGYTKGSGWGDYDNDGRPDLYLSRLGMTNVLFHNDGPGPDGTWKFTDVTAAAGVGEPIMSFPTWWWDYDNDGWLDLLVSGYGAKGEILQGTAAGEVLADYLDLPTSMDRLHLYRNRRDGTFEDAAPKAGVDGVFLTMGSNYGDFDNDGWDDFYLGTGNPDLRSLLPNRAFHNVGDGTFHDITTSGGFGNLQKGHAVSFADLDNDGDQDVYEDLGGAFEADWYPNVLFENPGHLPNRWATLRLVGPGANPSAIGARVAVRLATPRGPRMLHRVVGSGGSFGANSLQVELGLGDATAVEEVSVRWPGGPTEVITGVGLNAIWRLTAGVARAQPVVQPSFTLGGAVFGPAALE